MKDNSEIARCDEAFKKFCESADYHKDLDQETRQRVWNAFRCGWLSALLEEIRK